MCNVLNKDGRLFATNSLTYSNGNAHVYQSLLQQFQTYQSKSGETYQFACLWFSIRLCNRIYILSNMKRIEVYIKSNVCFKKIWTNHISDTVLQFVQVFLKQTLLGIYNSVMKIDYFHFSSDFIILYCRKRLRLNPRNLNNPKSQFLTHCEFCRPWKPSWDRYHLYIT